MKRKSCIKEVRNSISFLEGIGELNVECDDSANIFTLGKHTHTPGAQVEFAEKLCNWLNPHSVFPARGSCHNTVNEGISSTKKLRLGEFVMYDLRANFPLETNGKLFSFWIAKLNNKNATVPILGIGKALCSTVLQLSTSCNLTWTA